MYFNPTYTPPYNIVGNQMPYNQPYKGLKEALLLIKDAVEDERKDELFYGHLISLAPNEEQEQIIISIRDDEEKHNKMFREIYYSLTNMEIRSPENLYFEEPESYVEGLTQALFGELSAIEKYRDIRAGLPTRNHRDMLFEIITDEIKHSAKYNYLLTVNLSSKSKGLFGKLKL